MAEKYDRINYKQTLYNYSQQNLNKNAVDNDEYVKSISNEYRRISNLVKAEESKTGSSGAGFAAALDGGILSRNPNVKPSMPLPPDNQLPNLYLKGLNWGFGKNNFNNIPAKNLNQNAMQLKQTIDIINSPELYKWWAKFNELHGSYTHALEYYQKANDIIHSTKLLCQLGKSDIAKEEINIFKNNKIDNLENEINFTNQEELVSDANSNILLNKNANVGQEKLLNANKSAYKGACYRLAWHEEEENPKEAVKFYQLADAPHSAIRVAKMNDLDDLLMDMAMGSSNSLDILETAQYFELQGSNERAAQLFIKGGDVNKGFTSIINNANFSDEDSLVDLLERCIDALTIGDQGSREVNNLDLEGDAENIDFEKLKIRGKSEAKMKNQETQLPKPVLSKISDLLR